MNDSFLLSAFTAKQQEKGKVSRLIKGVSEPECFRLSLSQNSKIRKLTFLGLIMLMVFSSSAQDVNRIISLAPSLTENIYLLGAKEKLVGCTTFCTQAVDDGVQEIGSTIDVNVEKIFALQPDIILTMQLTKPQDIEAMKKLGLNVITIPTPKSFEEICKQTIEIGNLIGIGKYARDIISETKQTVEEIKNRFDKQEKQAKIFFQIGANPIFTVLENTFMDDFIKFVNGENIANGLSKGTMTRESILIKNPDVILIASMGGFGKEEKEVWMNFEGIEAVKKNRVYIVASETSCSPTPLNFAKALIDIENFINQ